MRSKYQPSLQGWCNEQEQYFWYRQKKPSYHWIYLTGCLNLSKEKPSSLNSYKLRIENWRYGNTMTLCIDSIAMNLSQWLQCNSFCFSHLPMFTIKASIFLDNSLYQKISAHHQGFLNNQWKSRISCTTFS